MCVCVGAVILDKSARLKEHYNGCVLGICHPWRKAFYLCDKVTLIGFFPRWKYFKFGRHLHSKLSLSTQKRFSDSEQSFLRIRNLPGNDCVSPGQLQVANFSFELPSP